MDPHTFAVFDFENPSSMILTLLEDDMPFCRILPVFGMFHDDRLDQQHGSPTMPQPSQLTCHAHTWHRMARELLYFAMVATGTVLCQLELGD